jgi:DNA polymerase-1
MKKEYSDILASLKESEPLSQGPNDRVLLIDGLNTFIRSYTCNPTTNDAGVHVGGIKGFLLSIGYAIRTIKPTRVIICFDGKGGSAKRKKMFPDYKAQRTFKVRLSRINSNVSVQDEKVNMTQQILRLMEYIDKLPVTVMATERIEADDAIAYIAKQVLPNSQHFIMSTDTDFLQLIDERIQVWSPTAKKFYFRQDMQERFKLKPENYILYKSLLGDKSDNIPGIKGLGQKTLEKRLPILFGSNTITMDNVIEYAEANKSEAKVLADVAASRKMLDLNYKLMQLEEVDIHGGAKESIRNIVERPMQRLEKTEFLKYTLEDQMTIVKNPEFWLRDSFNHLDVMSSLEQQK